MSHQVSMSTPPVSNQQSKLAAAPVEKNTPAVSIDKVAASSHDATPDPSSIVSISPEGKALSDAAQGGTHHT